MEGPFAAFKWLALANDWQVFAEGFGMTLLYTASSFSLALVLGVVSGMISTTRSRFFRVLVRIYVEIFQNTPLVIQIFFLYNGLPYLGLVLPVFAVGALGVGVYHGAYFSEAIRAGIQSVPKGQMEAALSQGLSHWGALRHIVIPQALPTILPPLTNQVIYLVRNTAVMAMVSGGDLMFRSDSWASEHLHYGPAYVVAGLLYFSICFPLSRLARRLERNSTFSQAGAKT